MITLCCVCLLRFAPLRKAGSRAARLPITPCMKAGLLPELSVPIEGFRSWPRKPLLNPPVLFVAPPFERFDLPLLAICYAEAVPTEWRVSDVYVSFGL